VADEVAKDGFRAQPGPQKKANNYELRDQMAIGPVPHACRTSGVPGVAGVEKQTSAKAAPRELTKGEKYNLRAATEVNYRKELARLGPP
jgi:hypothetical protein